MVKSSVAVREKNSVIWWQKDGQTEKVGGEDRLLAVMFPLSAERSSSGMDNEPDGGSEKQVKKRMKPALKRKSHYKFMKALQCQHAWCA